MWVFYSSQWPLSSHDDTITHLERHYLPPWYQRQSILFWYTVPARKEPLSIADIERKAEMTSPLSTGFHSSWTLIVVWNGNWSRIVIDEGPPFPPWLLQWPLSKFSCSAETTYRRYSRFNADWNRSRENTTSPCNTIITSGIGYLPGDNVLISWYARKSNYVEAPE